MAVFRVLRRRQAAPDAKHLTWNLHGAAADELVFVSGHPGSLRRDSTMSELVLQRDFFDPIFQESTAESLAILRAYAAAGPTRPEKSRHAFSACRTAKRPRPAAPAVCWTRP